MMLLLIYFFLPPSFEVAGKLFLSLLIEALPPLSRFPRILSLREEFFSSACDLLFFFGESEQDRWLLIWSGTTLLAWCNPFPTQAGSLLDFEGFRDFLNAFFFGSAPFFPSSGVMETFSIQFFPPKVEDLALL